MSSKHLMGWLFALLLSVTGLPGVISLSKINAQPKINAQLSPEDRQLFAWFDSLEFDKFAHLPLIRIETGPGAHYIDEEPENHIEFGFLIQETDKEFSYWDLALEKNDCLKKTEGFAKNYRVDFKRFNIEAAATDLIRQIEEEQEKDWHERGFDRFGETISQSCEVFCLARACFQQNKQRAAAELLKLAKKLSDQSRDVSLGKVSLKQGLSIDLGHALFWRTILKFDDPEIPLQEIAGDLGRLQKHFPKSTHIARAASMHSLVLQMIREAKKHQPISDWKKLSVKEQVAEWIFLLREQDGQQFMQPGACDIFYYDREFFHSDVPADKRKPPSPAQRLVDIGLPAVPHLIKILDDQRFTRSVGYHRDFYFSHHVLRIGDCAERIIERISGGAIQSLRYRDPDDNKGRSTTFRSRAGRWLQDIHDKGEKQVLIELTLNADEASPEQAHQLIEKHPQIALKHIQTAIGKTKSDWVAERLIDAAAKLGKAAAPFFEEELKSSKSRRLRIVLANYLYPWNPRLREASLIQEFERAMKESEKMAVRFNRFEPENSDLEDYFDDLETLVDSMLLGDSPTLAQYMVEDFEQWPLGIQFEVLETIASQFELRWQPRKDFAIAPEEIHKLEFVPFSEEVKSKLEKLFFHQIDNPVQFRESRRTPSVYGHDSVRLCDISLKLLSKCLPNEYSYKATGSFLEQEKQRIKAINHFRSKNKLPPIPPPIPSARDREKMGQAEQALQRIIAEKSAADRKTSSKRYRRRWSESGLPPLLRELETLPQNHPAFSDLNTLAKSISGTVVEIRNVGKPSDPSAFEAAVKSWNGKRLTSEMLLTAIWKYLESPAEESTGIYLSVRKGEKEQGLRVEYALTRVWSPKMGIDAFYDLDYVVRVEGKPILNSGTNRNVDSTKGSNMFDEFIESAYDALEESADKTFGIHFIMRRSM